MTIICALQAKDGTYIGSDTSLTAGDRQLASNYKKWIVYRSWALGFAGCWKVFNVIQSNYQYILTGVKSPEDVVIKMEKVFNKVGVGKREGDDYTIDYGQSILIVKKNGPVFHLDSLLAISEIPKNVLWAEGSGSDIGLGAGNVLPEREPEARVRSAIDMAKEYCTNCAGETFVTKL